MADENADGLSLRKRLAHGDALPSGDFGVAALSSHAGGTGAGKSEAAGAMPDSNRTPLHGSNQGNPDHGEFK